MGVGMTRSIRNAVGKADLHDLAQVHYGYLVADEFHHPKVVRDEEVGEPEPRWNPSNGARPSPPE